MRLFQLSLLFLLTFQLQAQSIYFVFNDSIPVIKGIDTLDRAWSGGLQAPQINKIDINNDGVKDLVTFDRYDRNISVFLSINGVYTFAPDYRDYLPLVSNWVLMKDYNCDGKNDLFISATGSAIAVYQNITVPGDTTPSFQLETSLLTGVDGPVIVSLGDVPSILDVDNDGDLDILSFDGGGNYVVHYRNMSMDDFSNCDNLSFKKETLCWGHFRESPLDNSVTLGDDCGGNKPQNNNTPQTPLSNKSSMHIGSTLLALDADGDGDKELLVGDISSSQMVLLTNGGTPTSAVFTAQTNNYPLSQPLEIYSFPSAYHIDVDNDGKRDLVAAPNDGSETSGKNFEQIYYYHNDGTDINPDFQFQQMDFITDQAIEQGADAAPVFFDYDDDGDQDLLIGSFGLRTQPISIFNSILLLENIGDSANAIFEYKDTDYAGISNMPYYNITPTFGDLDGDGKEEMLIGELNGGLHLFTDTSLAINPAEYKLTQPNYKGIVVGWNSTPYLIDFDHDNDLDLFVGERNGNINYFENIGNSTVPTFTQITDSVGKILIKDPSINAGYSAPIIVDLDTNGIYDLVTGSQLGDVHIYLNVENRLDSNLTDMSNIYYNKIIKGYSNFEYGKRSFPAITDINDDNLPDLCLGIHRGGVHFFKNNSDTILPWIDGVKPPVEGLMTVFPNPTNAVLYVKIPENLNNGKIKFEIFNLLGEQIFTKYSTHQNNSIYQLDINRLKVGTYFLLVSDNKAVLGKSKLIKSY